MEQKPASLKQQIPIGLETQELIKTIQIPQESQTLQEPEPDQGYPILEL